MIVKKKSKRTSLKYKPEPLANFVHMNTWRERGVSEAFIELMCGRLLEYFADKDKLCIEEFLVDNQIHTNTYHGWRKQNKKLDDVHKFVKMMLGTRREKGMLRKELDSKPGMYTQYQYSEHWKAADDYWAEIKHLEKEQQKQNIAIYMEALKPEEDKNPKEGNERDETERINE